jgi:hypothetical protein
MGYAPTALSEGIAHLLAGLVGAAFVVIGSQLFPVGGGPDVPVLVIFLVPNVLMSAIGFALGRYASVTTGWTIGLVTFGGIAAGVVMNAFYDSQVHHVDHNLFPFEIAIDSFLVIPGVIVG